MSNRLFQGIIHQMRDLIKRTIGIIDENGVIIACSELKKIGEIRQEAKSELSFSTGTIYFESYTYKVIGTSSKWEYAVFVEGNDEVAENSAKLLSISLQSIKELYDEKFDKASFVKNVMLDNILPSDIYVRSKELKFDQDSYRIVMLIRIMSKSDMFTFDMIQNIFPDKSHDYVISVNESDVALVREMSEEPDTESLKKVADNILNTLNTEFFVKASIGIGTPVVKLKDISKSYKEAQIALEVGKVFDNEKEIIFYDNLGLGRLVYQLPSTLCEMFLDEIFDDNAFDLLDRETLLTVQCFYENNLNISETARKLFVHRNTLVYRLDKIRRITGLDIREFDNAVTFKVAMMVKRYLMSKPIKF